MRHWIILGIVLALLAGCGAAPAADAPTAAPTAIPTLAEYAPILKQQLIDDKLIIQSIEVEEGALPTVTIAYQIGTQSANPVEIGPAVERAIYVMSKRIASQIEAGTAIDRAVLVLMFNETQKVGATSINTRDMVAWSKGEITDQQYQTRWSQQLST